MRRFVLCLLFFSYAFGVYSQFRLNVPYPDTLNKRRLTTTLVVETGTYFSMLSFLSYIWYKDLERTPFHLYNDAAGHLQMDKAGHAYGAYWESSSAYHALRRAGVKKNKALIFGGPIGLVFQTPIEIFDGLYQGWGFSWPDMVANTLGTFMFMSQEMIFDKQLFVLKFSYLPSVYPKYHPTLLGESHFSRFFLDYNAHTYWLSGNLEQLTSSKKIPPWLNIAFGYSADGLIGTFENPRYLHGEPFPHFERYRQYLFSLDVDFSKIPTRKKVLKLLFRALNMIKMPFPTLEYNRIEGLKFRYLYY